MKMPHKKMGRPTKRPNPELLALLYKNHTSKEIAEMYDVSASTVRMWACRLRKESENE